MDAAIVVLLVEDEPLILIGMQDALEDGGYAVLTASNGSDAMSLLDERHIELAGMITDIRLGEGPNGWDVARHARELKHELPIVYISADRIDDWPVEGVPKTIALQKPFADAQLITAISTLITQAGSPN